MANTKRTNLKKGSRLACVPCGREVVVDDCGTSLETIWCCGKPMKNGRHAKSRKPGLKVKDVMTKEAIWVTPQTSLREAANKMKTGDIGALPVCDGEKLIGFVTDRDIVIRSIAKGKDPNTVTISEVMSPEIDYCLENEDINKIAQRMERKKIRRLPVISHDKKLVGMISLGDLATRRAQKAACEILERVSAPNK